MELEFYHISLLIGNNLTIIAPKRMADLKMQWSLDYDKRTAFLLVPPYYIAITKIRHCITKIYSS